MHTRMAPGIALALAMAFPAATYAQPPTRLADAARAERHRLALTDPAARQRQIHDLHLSIEQLELQRDRIDMGGPIAATVLGAVGLAGGVITAVVVPLTARATSAAIGGVACLSSLGAYCGDPGPPDWMPLVMGIGAGVAVVGLVALVLGAGGLNAAREQRRPIGLRLREDRRELQFLESIDVSIGDQAGTVSVRARF